MTDSPRNYTSHSGFTLIELMIVVAIVAIIFLIATPNYQQHVVKTKRSEATSNLLAIAAALEKEYLKNNVYTTNLTTLNLPELSVASVEHAYTYAITLESGGYTATATAVEGGNQAGVDSDCTPLSLDHTGRRTPAACW